MGYVSTITEDVLGSVNVKGCLVQTEGVSLHSLCLDGNRRVPTVRPVFWMGGGGVPPGSGGQHVTLGQTHQDNGVRGEIDVQATKVWTAATPASFIWRRSTEMTGSNWAEPGHSALQVC